MTAVRAAAAVFTVFLVTACGGAAEKATDKESPTEKPSSSPSSTNASQEELQAKIVANSPPTNLTWALPKAPANWKKQETEPGVMQWQVGSQPCVVTISQPKGVGEAKEPTSDQVVIHEFQKIQRGVSTAGATAQPKVISADTVMVKNIVTGLDGETMTKFSTGGADFGNGAEARVRAHRSGDFALIASAVCGKGLMPKVYDTEIEPFMSSLVARTTY